MPVHLGCIISILCDNEPLEEFAAQVDDNVASCWVASEVGKVSPVTSSAGSAIYASAKATGV
jgi:hypothetical protein